MHLFILISLMKFYKIIEQVLTLWTFSAGAKRQVNWKCYFTRKYWTDHNVKHQLNVVCSFHEKGEDHGDRHVDGRLILRGIFKTSQDVDWIFLTEDRFQWHILVNTLVNLCVPCEVRNLFSSRGNVNLSRTDLWNFGVQYLCTFFVKQILGCEESCKFLLMLHFM